MTNETNIIDSVTSINSKIAQLSKHMKVKKSSAGLTKPSLEERKEKNRKKEKNRRKANLKKHK